MLLADRFDFAVCKRLGKKSVWANTSFASSAERLISPRWVGALVKRIAVRAVWWKVDVLWSQMSVCTAAPRQHGSGTHLSAERWTRLQRACTSENLPHLIRMEPGTGDRGVVEFWKCRFAFVSQMNNWGQNDCVLSHLCESLKLKLYWDWQDWAGESWVCSRTSPSASQAVLISWMHCFFFFHMLHGGKQTGQSRSLIAHSSMS